MHDMPKSDGEHRSIKTAKGADREARLAVKLRQNLVRRKDKARAMAKSADAPADMSPMPADRDRGE